MERRHDSGTVLERTADGASHAVGAFEVLGNETRLSILLALWEAFDPFAGDAMDTEANHLSFSELRDRVGIRQGAQFNYHLDKLVGVFVRKTEDGYALRPAGHEILRTIIAIGGSEEVTESATELDLPCPLCGGRTEITIEDQRLYRACTECEGYARLGESEPSGVLLRTLATPALQRHRDPPEVFHAARTQIYHDYALRTAGICPECSGAVEMGLHVCEDHESNADGPCEACGRRWNPAVRFTCIVCKHWNTTSVTEVCMRHPAVAGFCWENGIELGFDAADTARWLANLSVGDHSGDADTQEETDGFTHSVDVEERIVSEDPLRVRVTIRHADEELRLTCDETLTVVDATQARISDRA